MEVLGECSLERVLDLQRAFLEAFNAGDVQRLRSLLDVEHDLDPEQRWFAVLPREPDVVSTGVFTSTPTEFLDWVNRRSGTHERWSVLEFVRFEPTAADRVTVTLALLREADDFIAKPLLALFEFDCGRGTVRSLVVGAVGADSMPERPGDLLAVALAQRPLQFTGARDPCPRSAWAFDVFVGDGPVYLALGPDAVVNVEESPSPSGTVVSTEVAIPASERGPVLLRLLSLETDTPVPLGGEASWIYVAPSERRQRVVPIELSFPQPGCYVLQADGATWQQAIVVQVVDEPVARLAPQIADAVLPAQLKVTSAWRDGPDTIRVGLVGPGVVARLSIGVGGPGTPELGEGQQCEQLAERLRLCWVSHPVWGWPQTAVWDDGLWRYHFVVLTASRDAWSGDELRALVLAVSAAEEVPRSVAPDGE